MQWASTYFVEVKGISVDRAAGFASLLRLPIWGTGSLRKTLKYIKQFWKRRKHEYHSISWSI